MLRISLSTYDANLTDANAIIEFLIICLFCQKSFVGLYLNPKNGVDVVVD